MKKTLLALFVLSPFAALAATPAQPMIGNYHAVGYTTCGGFKVLSSAISNENLMVLQITDPISKASQIYYGNRTDDESEKVQYVLSNYDEKTKQFTPDPSNTTINFGIKMGHPGTPGNDLYNLTMGGQTYICKQFTIFNSLSKK
ncbi:MAG: hypothetical protein ACTH5S_06295 [Hafnia alvei]|uniref:hypothetical protein n=1 Tax=Hafnia alvei TaxID=569 RepID=UPI003F8FAE06